MTTLAAEPTPQPLSPHAYRARCFVLLLLAAVVAGAVVGALDWPVRDEAQLGAWIVLPFFLLWLHSDLRVHAVTTRERWFWLLVSCSAALHPVGFCGALVYALRFRGWTGIVQFLVCVWLPLGLLGGLSGMFADAIAHWIRGVHY